MFKHDTRVDSHTDEQKVFEQPEIVILDEDQENEEIDKGCIEEDHVELRLQINHGGVPMNYGVKDEEMKFVESTGIAISDEQEKEGVSKQCIKEDNAEDRSPINVAGLLGNSESDENHNKKQQIEPSEDHKVEEEDDSDLNVGNDSYEMLVDDSDNEQTSTSSDNDEPEAPLTDAEVEEIISEFLEVESKAAEAQESLEHESLARVESEVRAELAETLNGDELDKAVSAEMDTFIEEWESVLNDLENQSVVLLEQLDGAGIELPMLYKLIEIQAPDACSTEAWKKRAHWVGIRTSDELDQSVKDAEAYLQSCRPVRKKHGRLLENGASGYLAKNLSIKDGDNSNKDLEWGWSSFGNLIHSGQHLESTSFGSKNWEAIYLANTPQEAANLGLKLPGVDEVEEIGELDENPFFNEAIRNENEIGMSEEQKKKYKKVREEEDEKVTRKLHSRLKRRRTRKRNSQEVIEKEILVHMPLLNEAQTSLEISSAKNDVSADNADFSAQIIESSTEMTMEAKDGPLYNSVSHKRPHENEDSEIAMKKSRTVIIDLDDEEDMIHNNSPSHDSAKGQSQSLPVKKDIHIVDIEILPTASPVSNSHCIIDITDEIHCTSCSDVLKASDAHRHPILKVIICGSCNFLVLEKMKSEDSNPGVYCSWCVGCKDLIQCNSCKALFCSMCISKHIGETRMAEIKANGWDCFLCLSESLHQFVSECEKVLGGSMGSSSESESELSGSDINVGTGFSSKRKRKKRIRRILDDAELGEETKKKIAIEKARQEHLESMQAQSTSKLCTISRGSTQGILAESSVDDVIKGYIVNIVREEAEDPVRIPSSISAKLKPHQVAGIRFMWYNIIQSIKKVKSGDTGLGCILAHTMGLGKTFQVIAFLYTAMRAIDLGLKTALIVTPVNVLHNWRHEFVKWRPMELKPLRVLMLEDVSRERRADLLSKWRVKGGVLLIGYAAFRNLSLGRHIKDRRTAVEICNALHDGPDILVCDEAHMIKNTKADITQALKQVKSQRRIALTGSPLQNNLMEYYCMVDFVREGYLGSSHEFRNRFQNPIENGQHANATMDDVKIMNQRSHILYEQLKGFVQRMDMSIVKKNLPPKTVFVITVKLSPIQRKLYKRFLEVHGFTSEKNSEKAVRPSCFFAGYQALAQIWNHPGLLQLAKEQKNHARREDAVENFFLDDISSEDNMESDLLNGEKQRAKNFNLSKRTDGVLSAEDIDWWEDLLEEQIYKEADYSGKMVLLLQILAMSSEVGDKALVFSQSLTTLDLIELFLSKLPCKGREGKYWKQGKDWYRLDGSTQAAERQKLVERFNEPTNKRVKCTLISTRAGSLGINLHAANRVIIVDGSWNPTHDLQAIYRVWRYGQTKPVYAYRLMAHGTMEEKIYKRQVTKEGLAARVVDRQQIHRTMSKEEILHLFEFGDDEPAHALEQNQAQVLFSGEKTGVELGKSKSLPLSNGSACSDKFMETLLRRYYPRWIASYHEHETLLQENEAERLSKEEQEMAWQSYQRSLEWEEVGRVVFDEVKPTKNTSLPESSNAAQGKSSSRSNSVNQKKCTNLAHLLTLRSSGTKSGSSTLCRECSQEISWENLNRDGKSR